MSFYRSDPINHFKMVLPRESAWEIMNQLGNWDIYIRTKKDNTHCPNHHTSTIKAFPLSGETM